MNGVRVDGKKIASDILASLTADINFKINQPKPTLAIISVGENSASQSYIRQKQKSAAQIGAKVIICNESRTCTSIKLRTIIEQYNTDPSVHGIIIQRPLPRHLAHTTDLLNSVDPKKDIDGFVPGSFFVTPVAQAVETILKHIYTLSTTKQKSQNQSFLSWLHHKNIAIIGRGETAGKPIADYLNRRLTKIETGVATKSDDCTIGPLCRNKHQCATSVIHSQTLNPNQILKNADIIISCVGKRGIVTKTNCKPDVILVSVGIWRDSTGKLHGDYEEDDIKDIAAYYTPTPGGVGPVNVACLMQNVVASFSLKPTLS